MSARPDFLYIGTSKAGSTWLFRALSWHPQIYVYPGKNLGYFSSRYELGPDWYISNFDPGPEHRVTGEVSHSYLVSEDAPARIHKDFPAIKMIVSLRDPVQRTFSDYLDCVKNGKLHGTFEEEIDRTPALINKSRYGTQIERYLKLFDRKQLHIASFDELVAAPERFAAEIFDFLGVDALPLPPKLGQKVLPAGTPRSELAVSTAKRLSRLTRRLGLHSIRGKVKISPTIRNMLYRPFDKRPVMKPETETRLRKIFAPDVRLLDSVAGTNFASLWGYTPADFDRAVEVRWAAPRTGSKNGEAECRTS